MKRLLFVVFICFFLFLSTLAQINEGLPAISKQDLPGATFSPLRTFSGESLYGYIDGGADLYLEYGFNEVTVSEFSYLKGKYKVEIFRMNNPESAYGIFSVSRFRCRTRPTITTYTCQNKYQLQICSGSYYVSIINEAGTEDDSTISIFIGEKIIGKITEPSADLSVYLPGISPEKVKNESILVRGKLGVINGAQDLDGYLKEMKDYVALILNTSEKIFISIRFKDMEALNRFGVSHGWDIDKLSPKAYQMKTGESVRKLNENHVLIEITSNT